jgi:predicted 3-demethylubiquinone-9 3-methyltransferase (glyoxalase superfamily)
MAKDINVGYPITFPPIISFVVDCETQEEIDKMLENLSTDGKADQCWWLGDKYGMSWPIVPMVLGQMIGDTDSKKSEKVMKTKLQMKKINIKDIEQAYELQWCHSSLFCNPVVYFQYRISKINN